MAEDIMWALRRTKVLETIKKGERLDSRKFDEYRKIEIKKNISENAEGSARVKIGKTEVVAGAKVLLGTPFPDKPDQGSISIGAEFLPIAGPEYETGPPGPEEVELARVVDRGIRESKCIDFKKLCVEKKEKVWVVFIDVYALNDDGNMLDASSIAALSSLLDAKIPKLEKGEIVKGEYSGKISLSRKPLLTTVAKVGGQVLLDPNLAEEKTKEARYSVATTDDNFICACQKGWPGSFTAKEIEDANALAFKKAKEIRKLL